MGYETAFLYFGLGQGVVVMMLAIGLTDPRLALHVPLRWDKEASPSGFHARVTATTLESRPRRRYVAILQFAKGHPCSMSH